MMRPKSSNLLHQNSALAISRFPAADSRSGTSGDLFRLFADRTPEGNLREFDSSPQFGFPMQCVLGILFATFTSKVPIKGGESPDEEG
jgi:hypothetical protein